MSEILAALNVWGPQSPDALSRDLAQPPDYVRRAIDAAVAAHHVRRVGTAPEVYALTGTGLDAASEFLSKWRLGMMDRRVVVWWSDRARVMVTSPARLLPDGFRWGATPEHAAWRWPGVVESRAQGSGVITERWRRMGGAEWRACLRQHAGHPKIPRLRRLLCRLYGAQVVALAEQPAPEAHHV
jgi:hypothetical protein